MSRCTHDDKPSQISMTYSKQILELLEKEGCQNKLKPLFFDIAEIERVLMVDKTIDVNVFSQLFHQMYGQCNYVVESKNHNFNIL